ncbi:MAG: type II secretion system protein [Candidatus Binatia bacterium]
MNIKIGSAGAKLAPRYRSLLLTNKAFTLVEVIVILAVVSILVAIVTPTVLKYIAEAQQSRAEEDVRNISVVLNDLIKDTGQYPGSKLPIVATIQTTFLCGPGTNLGGLWGDDTTCADLIMHIVENDPSQDGTTGSTGDYRTTGRRKYKGPYVQIINEDPWGNAYQINASSLIGGDTNPTWIISAGPNGTFETVPTATAIAGDDMGVRLK